MDTQHRTQPTTKLILTRHIALVLVAIFVFSASLRSHAQVHTSESDTTFTNTSLATALVQQTSVSPTIDGVIDASWSVANRYDLSNIIFGSAVTEADLSGSFRALYDDSYLYMLVEITDDISMSDSEKWWNDDVIEIYLDGNNSQGSTYDGVDDLQLGLRRDNTTAQPGSNSIAVPTGTLSQAVETGGGYRLEIAVPLSGVGISPSSGYEFGMTVHVIDDDDGGSEDTIRAWNSTAIGVSQNPSLMGTGRLIGGTAGTATPTTIPTTTSAPTATPQPTSNTGWQKIDDFESLSNGGIDGRNGWSGDGDVFVSTDPIDSSNNVLTFDGEELRAYKTMPASIANSDTGTVFFRMRRSGIVDAYGGASDIFLPNEFSDYKIQLGTQRDDSADFYIRDGTEFVRAENHFQNDTWYCIWLIANNANNTYKAYVKGGQFGSQTSVNAGGVTTFDFRESNSEALRTFYNRTNFDEGGIFYIDDPHVDPAAENLSEPVACPSSPTEPINTPPSLTNPGNQSNDVGDSVNLQLSATDVNGDPLSFTASGLPSGLTQNGGTIVGTINAAGTYNVTVVVNDGQGGSDSASFEWLVNDTAPSPTEGWLLIDNFESLPEGSIDGRNGWVGDEDAFVATDPDDANNKALTFDGLELRAYKALPAAINNSASGTIFFRMRRSGTIDAYGGATDNTAPAQFTDYEVQFGGQRDAPSNFYIRSGDGFVQSPSGFGNNTWYCVWLTVDNVANTYQAYVQGGQFTSRQQVNAGGVTTFDFRNGGANPLDTFYIRTNFDEGGRYYIDDAYVDTAQNNQSAPVACNSPPPPSCYTLTLQRSGSGADLTTTPERSPGCNAGEYEAGEQITLLAAPASGWQIEDWEGTSSDASANISNQVVMPDAHHTVHVTYAPLQYTLQISSSGDGFVTINPDRSSYIYGEIVTLTANAAPGHRFAGWSGDRTGSNSVLEVTMTDNISVIASFEPESATCFLLNKNSLGSGSSIAVSPLNSPGCSSNHYMPGEVLTLVAAPAVGWQIGGWAGTDADGSTGFQNSVTMPNSIHSVTVTYTPIQYSLVINVEGNGTVSRVEDKASYTFGDLVMLTAVPDENNQFMGWSGAISGNAPSNSVTIVNDTTVTAIFGPIVDGAEGCHKLELVAEGEGSEPAPSPNRSPGCPLGEYEAGTTVTLSAAPVVGTEVAGWRGTRDDSAVTLSNSIIMPNQVHEVTVLYSPNVYQIVFNHVGQGTITVLPQQESYAHGTEVDLVAAANVGWQFAGWYNSRGSVASNSEFKYKITSAENLMAIFQQDPVFLSRLEDVGGTIAADPDQQAYARGDTVTLSANPEPGWTFEAWEFDVPVGTQMTDSVVTITLNQDTTAHALFRQETYLSLVMQSDSPPPLTVTPVPTQEPTPAPLAWARLGGERGEYSDLAVIGNQQIFAASRFVEDRQGATGGIEVAALNQTCGLAGGLNLRYDQPTFSLDFDSTSLTAVAGTDQRGLHYSDDGGINWNPTSTGQNERVLSVAFSSNGDAYATRNRTNTEQGVYRSTDNGRNWATFSEQPDNPNFVRPIDDTIWFGTDGEGVRKVSLTRSSVQLDQFDGGLIGDALKTWDLVATSRQLFLATEDGVYETSRSNLNQWRPFGLTGTNVRSLVIGDNILYAGTWENGVYQRDLNTLATDWQPSSPNGPTDKIRRLVYVSDCQALMAAAEDGIWRLGETNSR